MPPVVQSPIIPPGALVVYLGITESDATAYASRWFLDSEVVTRDGSRRLVTDDASNTSHSREEQSLYHAIIRARLLAKRLTVVPLALTRRSEMDAVLSIAFQMDVPTVVVVLPKSSRLGLRAGDISEVVEDVYVLPSEDARPRFACLEPEHVGPAWDIVGDLHGCFDELMELLPKLGYVLGPLDALGRPDGALHPAGNRLCFVGDFGNRGPRNADCLLFASRLIAQGHLAVAGNHDVWTLALMNGHGSTHGSYGHDTQLQLADLSRIERDEIRTMLSGLPTHLLLDVPGAASVVVAHAGIPLELVGREYPHVRHFTCFGEMPNSMGGENVDWLWGYLASPTPSNRAANRGANRAGLAAAGKVDPAISSFLNDTATVTAEPESAAVAERRAPWCVHGHFAQRSGLATVCPNVVNIDTGCVYGGALSAFRYPACEIVSVASHGRYHTD